MNRRHAMAAMGLGGLALTGAAELAQSLKISLVLPELYGIDGKLSMPPTLRKAGYGFRFVVVMENISADDLHVWAEGNSAGHGTLSFEFTDPDGKKTHVHRQEQVWTKNVIRTERLAPRGLHARVIEYDPAPGKSSEWDSFPFRDKHHEVAMRAVFKQAMPKGASPEKLWTGLLYSESRKVMLWNT
jgi:hypothetical protein